MVLHVRVPGLAFLIAALQIVLARRAPTMFKLTQTLYRNSCATHSNCYRLLYCNYVCLRIHANNYTLVECLQL